MGAAAPCTTCPRPVLTDRRRGHGVQHLMLQKSQGEAEVKLVGDSINMPETIGMARSTSTGMHVAAVGTPSCKPVQSRKTRPRKRTELVRDPSNKSELLLTRGHGVTYYYAKNNMT